MSCYPHATGRHGHGTARQRLILFGRYPVPGKTKTRLIPLLGQVGAADFHRRLTEQSLAKVMACRPMASVDFCFSGANRSQVRSWLGRQPARLVAQRGDDLGERMRNAIFDAFDQGCRQAVLVGTDIPEMTKDHLADAYDALQTFDVVLGPSKDGGYWLIGLNRKADLFQNISWGGSTVLEQTKAAAHRLGLTFTCLPPLEDMDTPDDVKRAFPSEQWSTPYLSVIIPTLNEVDRIQKVIEHARSPECEIIVADGGSTDGTVQAAKITGKNVLSAPAGRAHQQNAGAAMARGKVLLFLHADTKLPADFPHQVFETLLDHRVVAGAFQFRTDYHHTGMRLIEKTVQIRSSLFQMPYGDQALFMTKSIFNRAGGFPKVPIAEDLYLVRRLGQMGRMGLAPGAAITSGRRWRQNGILRTTFTNYLIGIGCLIGFPAHKLAPLYRIGVKDPKTRNKANRHR